MVEPVKIIPPAKGIDKKIEIISLIPVPEVESNIIAQIGNSAPYYILAYGKSSLQYLVDYVPLPQFLAVVLKWTIKGLSYAAKQYSVKEKDIIK